ncbi:MAG: hypothetical protein U9R74_04485 [Pseudomonadota bacterium]|nr:hypothetical protein [Pseudomonadota bacterium]
MKHFYSQFRIGEKIGLSFGLVGLLFLAVIWQYHQTLQHTLSDYERLEAVFAEKWGHALRIEKQMLEARRAEKEFLLYRNEETASAVTESLHGVMTETEALAQVDTEGAEVAARISELVRTYRQLFDAIAEAWRTKGLDHNSGLQGAFRDTAHVLEDRAEHFKVGNLYLKLLQIRQAEKDLGLRREALYRDEVLRQIGAFEAQVNASGLEPEMKQALLWESGVYREAFLAYSEAVLVQDEVQGGTGPFSEAADRIEASISSHYIPHLGNNVLQLRRREKDYLLRGDQQYVGMALQELVRIQNQLDICDVSEVDKDAFEGLLSDYRRDFLALVDQNREIDRLQGEMRDTVAEVTRLVQKNGLYAEQAMQESIERIRNASTTNVRFMLWLAGLATLMGILSAVIITLSITRPLWRIAGFLDQLAFEEPIERIPTLPGGRDEVNAMAQSVNIMADHKARLVEWWKSSMRAAEAWEELEHSQRDRQAQADELQKKLSKLLHGISRHAQRLEKSHPHGKRLEDTLEIEKAAKSALAILDVMDGGRH